MQMPKDYSVLLEAFDLLSRLEWQFGRITHAGLTEEVREGIHNNIKAARSRLHDAAVLFETNAKM